MSDAPDRLRNLPRSATVAALPRATTITILPPDDPHEIVRAWIDAKTGTHWVQFAPMRRGAEREPVKHPFEYQPPSKVGVEKITAVRAAMKAAYETILEHVPAGRERALAITSLQQAGMWANAAVVFAEGEA